MNNSRTGSLALSMASWIIAAVALLVILKAHLLPALLAGLFVYELIRVLIPIINLGRLSGYRARMTAVAFLSVFVVALLSLLLLFLVHFLHSGAQSLPVLLTKVAEILEDARKLLPDWIVINLPTDEDSLKASMVALLKKHAAGLQSTGKAVGRIVMHILIGMVIGAIVSLREAKPPQDYKPLAGALVERMARLSLAFRRIVFAQIRIAALNTFFTWIYLFVVLPILGVHLPLAKTLVAITFVVGLLPVIGNLISNTFIVVVSLSHSLPVAVGSLAFLVLIHKLEYFLNAKIIGSRIHAHAWELLAAMLVMEALFGLPGVVAAPIYYAYLKSELADEGLI